MKIRSLAIEEAAAQKNKELLIVRTIYTKYETKTLEHLYIFLAHHRTFRNAFIEIRVLSVPFIAGLKSSSLNTFILSSLSIELVLAEKGIIVVWHLCSVGKAANSLQIGVSRD